RSRTTGRHRRGDQAAPTVGQGAANARIDRSPIRRKVVGRPAPRHPDGAAARPGARVTSTRRPVPPPGGPPTAPDGPDAPPRGIFPARTGDGGMDRRVLPPNLPPYCMTDRRSRGRRPAPSARPAPSEPRTSRPRRSRRRSSSNPYAAQSSEPRLTSLPTHRGAYQDTRQWLLETHGSVCAYCAGRIDSKLITLDHVTPRRGQSAYDRRDNLVLACTPCNAS